MAGVASSGFVQCYKSVVLSPCLLFRPYLRGRPSAPREFWRRRVLRILPAYYAQ